MPEMRVGEKEEDYVILERLDSFTSRPAAVNYLKISLVDTKLLFQYGNFNA